MSRGKDEEPLVDASLVILCLALVVPFSLFIGILLLIASNS